MSRARGYLSSEDLIRYLDGGIPKTLVQDADLLVWEDRTGIAVDPTSNRAADHMLYSARFLRLRPGIFFYSEICLPDRAPKHADAHLAGPLPLGGEGRQARVSIVEPVKWPRPTRLGDGALAVLATPGVFQHEPAWLPDANFPGLCSAAVPAPIPISGWDLAHSRPKPTRYACPPGSVYFFREEPPASAADAFLHLTTDRELDSTGYGLALKGVWNHE